MTYNSFLKYKKEIKNIVFLFEERRRIVMDLRIKKD
jgi:hypothetical protein